MTATPTTKKKAAVTPKLTVRTLGKDTGSSVDAPAFFQARVSLETVARVVHIARRRARVRRAHTKERAEVRGGGRKPWKQKGTGRSRHGSSRSPLWVGGGTTFGPRSRKERVVTPPVKERGQALAGAFAAHVTAGTLELLKLDKLPTKTKEFVEQTTLASGIVIVIDESHKELTRVTRNVPGVKVVSAHIVMPRDIVEANTVWVDQDALATLESRTGITSKTA
ncbi:MAG: 50S ribosomal protein L4 [Candidatus Andersenbacteria bacterium]